MAQILVRDLEEQVLNHLKQRAQRHHRSLENEIRDILHQAVQSDPEQFLKKAAKFRQKLEGQIFTPSETLLAQDRAR